MPDYPVQDWHPDQSGVMDITIAKDGTWWHEGAPILRSKLVQLFSKLLVREGDRYFLLTPVEKLAIEVEQTPFVMVQAELVTTDSDQAWHLITNVGESVVLQTEDQWYIDLEQVDPIPQVCVRDGLWAILSRQVYFDMAMQVEPQTLLETSVRPGAPVLGVVRSAGADFAFGYIHE